MTPVAPTPIAPAPTPADNKALLRRYWSEANAAGLLAIVDRYHAPDVVSHPPASASSQPLVGPDAYKRFVTARFYGSFPDLQTIVEDAVAEGDLVGLRVTAIGTHTGPLMGVPATGRRVRFTGTELFRLADGRIVEQWGEFDGVTLLQQLGLLPAPEQLAPPAGAAGAGRASPLDSAPAGGALEEHKAVIRRFFDEYFNRHDLRGLEALCTPAVVLHHGGAAQDLAAATHLAEAFLAAFPDCENTIEAMIAEGHTVFTRGVFRGTHRGPFMGLPPTGKPVSMTWMTFDRLVGGRIAERWAEQDTLGLLQQLGALPAPAH